MAAGLGFKDFVTGEVLTAADVDGYLMQGIWVFASAAARDAAVTSPQEGNACYLKDTNAVLTYSGSAWVSIAPSSSGGMTLLQSLSLSGASVTSSTFTATDYKNYFIVLSDIYLTNPNSDFLLRLNGDSGSNYCRSNVLLADTSVSGSRSTNGTSFSLGTIGALSGAGQRAYGTIQINRINDTSEVFISSELFATLSAGADVRFNQAGGVYNNSAAITSLTFLAPTNDFAAGTAYIYGVN